MFKVAILSFIKYDICGVRMLQVSLYRDASRRCRPMSAIYTRTMVKVLDNT
jgi:hypothetical protein